MGVVPVKVELHCHTSRYSGCAISRPEQALAAYAAAGYDVVYLTEHDAVWPEVELAELREMFPSLRIYGGLEKTVELLGFQHVLVLGTSDPAYLAMDDEDELLARARRQGHLTVLAHPFRWQGGDAILRYGLLPDAIEGRTGNHDETMARQSHAAAERFGLPVVNTSDCHAAMDVGRFWVETKRDITTPADIRAIILAGAYMNRQAAAQ